MATATDKTQCLTCGNDKPTTRCVGCLQHFCFTHLTEHRQQLNKQLDEITVLSKQIRFFPNPTKSFQMS